MKPLAGLRVVDLTQAMAAPFCTMNLADMGADVIKVEPPAGEDMRRGSVGRHGHSGTFVTINRSRSDGLRGFVGRFVRGRAQNGAINGARALLETTRRRLETN